MTDTAAAPALPCADPTLHVADSPYLNRELSQMEFNARVLDLARNEDRPLLERLKFVAIFAGNTDEFFQKRVGGLRAQEALGARSASSDGMSAADQLVAIRRCVAPMLADQARLVRDVLFPQLAEHGLAVVTWEQLDEDARHDLELHFVERIFPILTPLAIDPGRPFPHISSLSLNLMVVLSAPGRDERRLARLKVPASLPRFLPVSDTSVIPLEEVVAAHAGSLFPGMEIVEHHLFRVTRNADVALEEEGDVDDLLETIEGRLLRRRFGEAVRLEVQPGLADDVRQRLLAELELAEREVVEVDGLLDATGLWQLYGSGPGRLKAPAWEPVIPPRLHGVSGRRIFEEISRGDILVHHPYESFDDSVEVFVEAAADDPAVVAIKLTIYRTSESESAMVDALIRASQTGKQAVAMVELKARFDEEANIARARMLENAGVHVVYGFVGLKAHTKTLLVVREEGDELRSYCHVGTGNYNPKTARLYEDLGLLTADPLVGADLGQLFNTLTGFSEHRDWARLLVAPSTLRSRLLEEIRGQSHSDGRIVVKVNNCVDAEIIDALYTASQAGAQIDLVVRSQCCLRPGRQGMSENIRVRSLVGEFLEHSRIYRFGPPGDDATYYIGSADLMGRNLDRRFEALVPVRDAPNRARLEDILTTLLADDELAWELHDDGSWTRPTTSLGINAHERFKELARASVAP